MASLVPLHPTAAATAVAVALLTFVVYLLYEVLWGRQQRLMEKLRRQGISGPPPSFWYGNTLQMRRILLESRSEGGKKGRGIDSSYVSTLFPYLERWSKEYGRIFTCSMGRMQLLYVSHPDLVKDIGQFKSLDLGKPAYLQKEYGPLLGHGIITSNGDVWAHQRKTIAPEFFLEKVKGMVSLIVEATSPLLEAWKRQTDESEGLKEVIVDEDLRNFSADVISRVCFGSSYSRGKEIFSKLRDLQKALSNRDLLIGIFGMRFLPIKRNRQIWRLDQEIRALILNVVKERKDVLAAPHHKDFLQSIIESASSGRYSPDRTETFIVDNCKNIYFAGHETSAVSASWCLMLLAANSDWQARARAEVDEICRGQFPDFDMLRKMKVLTMVIQETLRLYPSAIFVTRGALKDIKLGSILVPKGTTIRVPIAMMHHDPDIWGPDAQEFRPERFTNGISAACKLPQSYIPFGIGTRSCVGQNLAMVELKVLLSLILSHFTFSLSPKYRHSPAFRLTIEPEFGVPLIMKKR